MRSKLFDPLCKTLFRKIQEDKITTNLGFSWKLKLININIYKEDTFYLSPPRKKFQTLKQVSSPPEIICRSSGVHVKHKTGPE